MEQLADEMNVTWNNEKWLREEHKQQRKQCDTLKQFGHSQIITVPTINEAIKERTKSERGHT